MENNAWWGRVAAVDNIDCKAEAHWSEAQAATFPCREFEISDLGFPTDRHFRGRSDLSLNIGGGNKRHVARERRTTLWRKPGSSA